MFYQKLETEEDRLTAKFIERIVILVLLVVTFFISTVIIDAGERGVVLKLGSVDRVIEEGFHFKIPLIEKVKKINVQTQKEEVSASSASKDLQEVTATIALNYNLLPDSVGILWQEIGRDYKSRIIDPAIQEAVKASTAKFTAEELITQRASVRDEIKLNLTERLKREYINVTEVSIVDFGFSASFDDAIESKVTAEQQALTAKNKLEQVKFEAEQRVTQAKAEAEAIKIQAQAIQNQGGAEYVNLKAIEKWNGVLPNYSLGGSVPFINLGK